MQKKMEELWQDPDYADRWIAAAKERMLGNSVVAFLQSREIQDRVDGPVKQELELSGNITLASTIAERRKRVGDDQ